jgi:hypothetical protein
MPTFKDANNAIRVFPELGGVARFWKGTGHLYQPKSGQWTPLCNVQGVEMHCLAEYSPKAKLIVFGGGDVKEGPPPLYRLDAKGQVTRLKALPFPQMHVQGTIFVADPVSGEFLAGEFRGDGPRTMYALDGVKDQWQKLPTTLPAGSFMIAARVPNYGVIMLCTANPAKVWLYKHTATDGSQPLRGK